MKAQACLQALLFTVFVYKSQAKLKNQVIKLNENTWRDILEGEWLVKFYAPWCPACQGIAPIWEKVADWSDDLNIKVGEIDVSEEAGLSGRFFITALPTIYHVRNGEFRRYLGPRTEDDIISYIDEKKYEEVEPVSWWKHPNSIQMSLLSSVFRVSMQVRIMHNKMTDEWGFPVWLSYLFFALATIVAGLLLGLLLVVVADCMCPPRPPPHGEILHTSPTAESKAKKDDKKDEGGEEKQVKDGEEQKDEVVQGETTKEEDSTVRQRKVGPKEDGDGEEKSEKKEEEAS
ncbi:Thioredoxin-related transmembrane protein 1 [Holothuria leucospilota]|uniref:Thioredoxin-related transmembrane protein 1 n=1 Tax=Holothuria leucospilota TaxID=206669 RepID=A0A9Q1CIV7_HOLLE|nr:Thioredoxin-related transmembrane protein 1 [Holothuria leucospilota]